VACSGAALALFLCSVTAYLLLQRLSSSSLVLIYVLVRESGWEALRENKELFDQLQPSVSGSAIVRL
jgi:hypothetical protein